MCSNQNREEQAPFSWLLLALVGEGEAGIFGRVGYVAELRDTRLSRALLPPSRASQWPEMEELVEPARESHRVTALGELGEYITTLEGLEWA